MKLSKLARLVKQSGALYLCHVEDSGIWLGTRWGLYKASGLPETVDGDIMMTILDFDSKTADKIVVQERYFDTTRDMLGMNLSDAAAPDIEAKKVSVAAIYKGVFATALLCNDGELVFYDEEQLAPLADVFKESDYVRTVVRIDTAGNRYVVIRDGFDTVAGIMPMQVISKGFLGDLEDFHARCTEQYFREESRSKRRAEIQPEVVERDEMEETDNED